MGCGTVRGRLAGTDSRKIAHERESPAPFGAGRYRRMRAGGGRERLDRKPRARRSLDGKVAAQVKPMAQQLVTQEINGQMRPGGIIANGRR